MRRYLLLCTLLGATLANANAAAPALMPLPAKMDMGTGALAITGTFSAVSAGVSDAHLDAALNRLVARLARQTGIFISGGKPADAAHATLRVEAAARGADYPTLGEDESYQLDVTPEGARIRAATVDGALRGMETFLQLVVPGANGFEAPAVHIDDRPRFPWRGLMLDTCRHWMPVEVVLRNLDAMAAVKLNVFHWHLSEDQGFRVESKRFPRLQQTGSDGHYYTQADIRGVVAYARDRGIRVIPEFDMPGHTQAWFPGYPELAAGAPGATYEIGRHFGIFDPVMDPSREETYKFLDTFIAEMAALFPDPYFHIGGDEVNGKAWAASGRVQAFAKEQGFKGTKEIQLYFSQRIHKILQKHGKTMVGWDEILQPDLGAGTVIQSWRNQAALADSVHAGYRGILSWGYYLDHLSPASYHYGIDPQGGGAAQLTPEQAKNILGGEACMWAELIGPETIDSRVWPRTAAIAERFWSPREITDPESMYQRMEAVSRGLEWTGVRHRENYGPMLDRLAGNRFEPSLRVIADAVEGLGLGPRSSRKITTDTPLNRLVDAARPESESIRHLELAAARIVAHDPVSGGDEAGTLRRAFETWAANDVRFQSVADSSALLAELKPLSKDLSAVGVTGLKALDYLLRAQPAPSDWLAAQNAELTRMQKANTAEVSLAALRPVKRLMDALAQNR
jgi:hexosaminidase